MNQPRRAIVQVSIAEAVIVLTAACLLVGSIWAPWWVIEWLVLVVALVALLAVAIAVTGKGEARRFAAGFAILSIGYLSLSVLAEWKVLNVLSVNLDELPTTAVWERSYESIKREVYRYFDNNKVIPSSLEPQRDSQGFIVDKNGNTLGVHGSGGTKWRGIRKFYAPSAASYYAAGELLWTLLIGYLGGKFVVSFRRFQDNRETKNNPGE